MNLNEAREKLGVRTLSVMQDKTFCTVFLHFDDGRCHFSHGKDFGEAVKGAMAERRRHLKQREDFALEIGA